MVWACDDKRGTLRGKEAMVMQVQGRRKRGRPKRRWLVKVKDDIKEKGLCRLMMCTTVLHGGVCHRTSTPHKSGNKIKKKKKKGNVHIPIGKISDYLSNCLYGKKYHRLMRTI